MKWRRSCLGRCSMIILAASMVVVPNVFASEFEFELGGYVREHLGFNLGDSVETAKNDRYELSMARSTVQLEATASKDNVSLVAIGRAVGEVKTHYLETLEEMAIANGSTNLDMMDDWYNDITLREAYVEIKASDRVMLRLGKQQIVWGETDFFQALDLIHGYDYTWRTFLEGENEDTRKPLILANAMIDFPEQAGNLQIFIRPGFDDEEDIGNSYDMFGGRWALTPNKGFDFFPVVPYDFHHSEGDTDDVTGGIRWTGLLGNVNYSLSYFKTFRPDPVVNTAIGTAWKDAPTGPLGSFIFPQIDVYGLTASYAAAPPIDAVFSTEVAYINDMPYNFGSDWAGGALPGFGGIVAKDTLRWMVRMDKPLDLRNALGTNKPSFFTVQLFDTWILDYDDDDDIVDLAGYGATKDEHSMIATAVLGLNYMSDRVNPQLAVGYDVSYGGGFIIPSVAFAFGDSWRLNVEADLFLPKDSKAPGEVEKDTHLMGWFDEMSSLSVRLTYQF